MAISKRFLNGAAVPRRTGVRSNDEASLYHYLFLAMEELRFALDALERQSGGGGEEWRKVCATTEEELKALEDRVARLSLEHRIPFGHVDAGSTATVMTATVPGVTKLTDGVAAYITNGVVTSASGWTLNVNGLGALPVYSTLAAATRATTLFNVNYTLLFVYNSSRVAGGCWDAYYGYDSNTNTIGYQLRTNSMSLPMSDATVRYRLLFTSADGSKWVPANTSTSTSATAAKTVCQTKINPFGHIVYYGTTAAVAAGSRPSAASLWAQYVVTLGYSFNRSGAALTLTSWAPVYIKCSPQTDGSAIIDATTPYVQALPSGEDGYVYIYLGVAVSATTVELVPEHPVYYRKGGAIRVWDGDPSAV